MVVKPLFYDKKLERKYFYLPQICRKKSNFKNRILGSVSLAT